ncbi:hypothetical protein NX794_05305 [Streptomyces sp. LP11]|uniref:Uncharacterized protein n=1 Tax=Streptomyces pyxinicus TaxID=2970331 RepID=A0ABT2AWV3_9ACTN|nr:hypothetical protein [Streptomyces sp. LP11]MCS0600650.1 hypothetical protein [Streptomyces sp. LP11]
MPAREPPGADPAERHGLHAGLLTEEWQRLAKQRLAAVLGEIFGTPGPGVPTHAVIVRGTRAGHCWRPPTGRSTC